MEESTGFEPDPCKLGDPISNRSQTPSLYYFPWLPTEVSNPTLLVNSQVLSPRLIVGIGGPGANRTLIALDTCFTDRLQDHLRPTHGSPPRI